MALLAQRHRDWGCLLVLPPQSKNVALGARAGRLRHAWFPNCERLQIALNQKELACKSVAQPHVPMALLAQRHRDWGCLLVLPPQTCIWSSVPWACGSPAPKMGTSADRCQPGRASLQSCCSASSAHGRARTEAQRLGLLACLTTKNIKRILVCR